MSLETAIQQNTEALHALIAALGKGIPTTAAQVAAVVQEAGQAQTTEKPAKADKPVAKKQAAVATQEQPTQTSAASSTSSSTDTQGAEETAAAGVLYAAARELVLKLAATHREEIKKINAKHGIAKLSSLLSDENDFGSVTDQAKLDAVFADLQALGA